MSLFLLLYVGYILASKLLLIVAGSARVTLFFNPEGDYL